MDIIACHFVPQKKVYEGYKYKKTEGFTLFGSSSSSTTRTEEERVPINQKQLSYN